MKFHCPVCKSNNVLKVFIKGGSSKYVCKNCGKSSNDKIDFKIPIQLNVKEFFEVY
jgi:transposase-like protein